MNRIIKSLDINVISKNIESENQVEVLDKYSTSQSSQVIDKEIDKAKNISTENKNFHDKNNASEDRHFNQQNKENVIKEDIFLVEKRNLDVLIEELRNKNKVLQAKLEASVNLEISEGFKKGYADGEEKAYRELLLYKENLKDLLSLLKSRIEQHQTESEHLAVELTLTCLKRMLGSTLDMTEIIKNTIKSLLPNIVGNYKTVIRVAPDNAILIKELLEHNSNKNQFIIIEDNSIGLGGCILENEKGSWDARIDQQVDRLKKAYVNSLGSQSL